MHRRRVLTALLAAGLAVAACLALGACGGDGSGGGSGEEVVLTPEAVAPSLVEHEPEPEAAEADTGTPGPASRPGTPVELADAGPGGSLARPDYDGAASAPDALSPGAPTDAEVRAELRQARAQLSRFKRFLSTTAYLRTGPQARVLPDGTAVAPDDAPEPVKRVIQAGNAIASLPYKWGGGHATWRDTGYDCSGSVSFALAGAGLLDAPMASGQFVDWGAAGPGQWITIYANAGHIFMVVAGLRFDTTGQGRAGTRWQEEPRSTAGFAVRSIPGL